MGMGRRIAGRVRGAWNQRKARARLEGVARRVDALSIAEAGVADDGVPFVRLDHGPIFFGHPTRANLQPFYPGLSAATRERLPEVAFNVAMDIVIRYEQGGLKLGGPRKEAHYTPRPGHVCVEMGAYLGYYGMRLAERVGPAGRVIGIEPVPGNVALLRRNVEANQLGNFTVIPKGVWSGPSSVRFELASQDMQSASMVLGDRGGQAAEVEVDALDNLLGAVDCDRADLMIIQLNGVELEALEGLTQVDVANFAIAARYGEAGRSSVAEIRALLQGRGYSVAVEEERFIFARKTTGPGSR